MAIENYQSVDFHCGGCGSLMDIVTDEMERRTLICKKCGRRSIIVDSDEDRLNRAKIDEEIRLINERRDHPVKNGLKIIGAFAGMLLFIGVIYLFGKFLGFK